MLDFEVEISEPHRRSNDLVAFENENEDVMSELASTMVSVTIDDCEEKIDYNVSASFTMPQSSDQNSNPSYDVTF